MQTPDLKVIDLLGGFVGFIREAGFLGVLVAFGWALYSGRVYFGKDYDKVERRVGAVAEELATEKVRNAQLTVTVERLSVVLEKATGGFERSVAHRIAQEEGIDVADVLAEMASQKVGAHTRLAYPAKSRSRPRGVPRDAPGAAGQ